MPFNNILLYDDIFESYKKGDWENILKIQSVLNESYFLWPKPKKCDLEFISETVQSLHLNKIVSIGCGTGLLEWLIRATTGLNVTGIEVDKRYWSSRYARGVFIDLIFPEDDIFLNTIQDESAALLFCYFNNGEAFLKYLDIYRGACIIIIGPHDCGRHTDPAPFDSNIPPTWALWKSKEISKSGDYIAIYIKYVC